MSEEFVQRITPEEGFAAIASETRLRILRTLWESNDQTVAFSELRRAVGIRDPGQFNYHLDKLVGQFVTKTDGGYRLTQAGKHVNGAIASGMFTAHGRFDPIELTQKCQWSDDHLTVNYGDETLRIGCPSCSICPSEWAAPVPPAVFAGYDRDEIPDVASQYFRTISRRAINGFCPYCNGQMKPTVRPTGTLVGDRAPAADGAEDSDGQLPDTPVVWLVCQRCRSKAQLSLDHALLLSNPAVGNFHYANGIVVQDLPIWEFSDLSPIRTDVESRNPIRVNVTFRVKDSTCTVVVDGAFTIVRIDR